MQRLLLWRSAAICWAAQIYWMSASAKLSSDRTRSFLAELLERWFGWQPSTDTVRLLGLVLRKGAHVAEYAVLAFLVFQSLEGILTGRSRRVLWCVVLAATYALADEFHQAFVPGRGASLMDWGIDVAGACVAGWAVSDRAQTIPALTGRG
jgi:VanZ family protein